MTAIKLGSNVKDLITGFTGIVTARAEYLTGCTQYSLSPPVDKDGKLQDATWFDEGRLEVLDDGVSEKVKKSLAAAPKGGSTSNAPKARH